MVTENPVYREDTECREEKSRAEIVEAEVMRSSAKRVRGSVGPAGKPRMSLFWQVFGGTILSVVALGMITAYNQITTTDAELRHDVNQLQGDIVRKEELNARLTPLWNNIKELERTRIEVVSLSEQAKILGRSHELNTQAEVERQRDLQRQIDDLGRRLQVLADRLTALEAASRSLDVHGVAGKPSP
jgi:hypothetical protein